ncbi:MAG: transcriptional regulator/antitoxin, MazE [Patescibacteria group bacterium]|nr:transcriptional regulator/antitoxin, MazE [Patescibacteria group bacterium]
MKTHLKQWGNSLAVRLPRAATDALALADGSELDITVTDTALVITPATPPPSLGQLVAQVTPANRHPETHIGRAQ